MIELYLIRHAESEADTNRKLIGGRASNSPLSVNGVNQARQLKKRLLMNKIVFDIIYSSTAKRASSTAMLSTHKNNKITFHPDLEEMSQGDWSGQIRADIYTPEVIARIQKEQINFKAPNGESQREVADRYVKFIEENVMSIVNKKIAIYGHGYAFKCWLQRILNFDWKVMFPMILSNCSITKLIYDHDTKIWGVNYINSTEEIT